MTAIPPAAMALTSALGRFDRASVRMVEAATGAGDPAAALVDVVQAKAEVSAGVALVRFTDEMYKALLDVAREPRRRRK
ncbi:MAG: hypothetical protein K2P58_02885 [Hyphomonadaceae bacterium]|nr:hypothetical protein [Hyphomonadaceae bacterium]